MRAERLAMDGEAGAKEDYKYCAREGDTDLPYTMHQASN